MRAVTLISGACGIFRRDAAIQVNGYRHDTVFTSMAQARAVIATWVADYNTARPHSALGYQTPAAHAAKLKAMGPLSPPLRGSEPNPIAQTAPHGVTSPKALLTAG